MKKTHGTTGAPNYRRNPTSLGSGMRNAPPKTATQISGSEAKPAPPGHFPGVVGTGRTFKPKP